jgi:O-antigen/teichoic acid export membrane protein
MTNETLDRILLERLLPAEKALRETGIYSGVYKLSMPISLIIMAFRYAAEPFFFSKFKDADNTLSYARLLTVFSAVLSITLLAVMVNIRWLSPLFLRKPGYAEGLDIVWVLLLANIALGIFYNLTIWYKLSDQTMQGAWVSISAAVLAIGLNYWLIPLFSYRGSAWATLSVYVYMAIITWWLGRRYLSVDYQWKRIFAYIFMAVIISLIIKQALIGSSTLVFSIVGNTILIGFVLLIYYMEKSNPLHRKTIAGT